MSAEVPLEQALDDALFWLVSHDSPIGEEKALCDALVARLEKLPLAGPIRRVRDSIVVPLVAKGSRPHVALCGHTDTVRTENGPARREPGRIFGAGVSDMKSGLAVMLVLAERALARLDVDVTLVFYAREEGPYAENELGPVLEADAVLRAVDLAVCLEPSDNRMQLGCNGSIHATVTFEGKTGHSSRPWEGESAISKAAPFLMELAALAPRESHIDGLVYRTVTTVTQARDGGRGRNVVPDKLVLNVNHRFSPEHSPEQGKQHVLDLVKGRANVEWLDVSPGALPSASHPLVKKLVACGVRTVEPKQAWTDVARFSALGIPAINFGPGENAQAHQKNESCATSLVHEGYRIFERWLCSSVE